MRVLATFAATALLAGCESMQHVTVAPRVLVEACLQEAFPASGHGWGPMCSSLNDWNKYHGWAYGGGPPMTGKPTPEEAAALAAK